MARPSCLHGVHWPQDSTARKRDTPWATATRSSASSNTMNPVAPRPLPAASMSSYESGVSSAHAGRNGWETPDSTAWTPVPGAVRPDLLDHRSQRRAERHLADTGAQRRARHGADRRSRRRRRSELTEPRRTVRQDQRDVGQRLDVVGQRRRRPGRVGGLIVDAADIGRCGAGNGGRPSVTSRSAVSSPKRYSLGPATMSSSMPSAQPRGSNPLEGGAQAGELLGERALDGDDDAVSADRMSGDEGALQHPIRVADQQRAVLEAAGAHLCAVDDDGRPRVGDRPPLGTGREPCPAAPRSPMRRARRSCRRARASGLRRVQRPRQQRRSHPATQQVVGRGRARPARTWRERSPPGASRNPQDTAAKAAS